MQRKTTADAVAMPIDQRARKDLEAQILECGAVSTRLVGVGLGLYCNFAKSTQKFHIFAKFHAGGKTIYERIGDYPTLTCDEILEARNALYWKAMGKAAPKKEPKKEKKMEEKKDAQPQAAGNPEESAAPQAADGGKEAEAVRVVEEQTFLEKIRGLCFSIEGFDRTGQAAILRAAIAAEERTWQS